MSETVAGMEGLADAYGVLAGAVAQGLIPPEALTVSEWADRERFVPAESGSPWPGRWRTDRVPYMREIMDRMTPSDPCRSIVLKKSAQVAGSEAGLNLLGYLIAHDPAPVLVVLPSLDEAYKYSATKLTPMLDATPAVAAQVRRQVRGSAESSTTSFKRFPGGFMQLTGANSSKGLQMISARVLLAEEISEWPDDVDGRGDPLDLAEHRTTAWSEMGVKLVHISTPGEVGACRIEARWQASDQREWYTPCPHCRDYVTLIWDDIGYRSATPPHGAYAGCPGCGAEIEAHHRSDMLADGRWVPTFQDRQEQAPGRVLSPGAVEGWRQRDTEGRDPGYHIWRAQSPMVAWDDIAAMWLAIDGDPERHRVFTQQVLGQPYQADGDAPDWETLYQRREDRRLGQVPDGAVLMTGMTDVQKDRLEWGAWAWGPGMTGWYIDGGVIQGDPASAEVWRKLDEVRAKRWPVANGGEMALERMGVDSGYLSDTVYRYARGRPDVMATDGQGDPSRPYIGTPRRVGIKHSATGKRQGSVMLWPLGTHGLKIWLYSALARTLDGPDAETGEWPRGALRFPAECDQEYFRQLTAEYLDQREDRRGRARREWRKKRGQANEQLDIAVGARAVASHLGLDRYTDEQWETLARRRGMVYRGPQKQAKPEPAVAERDRTPERKSRPPRRRGRGGKMF